MTVPTTQKLKRREVDQHSWNPKSMKFPHTHTTKRRKRHINDSTSPILMLQDLEEINVEKIKVLNRWVANDGLEVATAYQD